MPVRPATYADLWAAAGVEAAAFQDNELLGEFMHPHRAKYPGHMQRDMFRGLRRRYLSEPETTIMLAFAPGAPRHVLGLGIWERWGREPPLTTVFGRVYYAIVRRVVGVWNAIEAVFWPNRAIDPSKKDVTDRAQPFVQHYWSGSRGKVWNLAVLGVDPKAQGMGVGKELVQWGFERAREEKIGCTVISADGKEGFYQKCGFDVYVGKATEGEGNPLSSLPGGAIFFWDNGIEWQGAEKSAGGMEDRT